MQRIIKIIITSICSLTLSTLMIAAASLIITKLRALPSQAMANTIVMIAIAISILISSILLSKAVGERGLINGAAVATVCCFIYLCVSYIITASNIRLNLLLLRCGTFILAGMIGGIIGVSEKKEISF